MVNKKPTPDIVTTYTLVRDNFTDDLELEIHNTIVPLRNKPGDIRITARWTGRNIARMYQLEDGQWQTENMADNHERARLPRPDEDATETSHSPEMKPVGPIKEYLTQALARYLELQWNTKAGCREFQTPSLENLQTAIEASIYAMENDYQNRELDYEENTITEIRDALDGILREELDPDIYGNARQWSGEDEIRLDQYNLAVRISAWGPEFPIRNQGITALIMGRPAEARGINTPSELVARAKAMLETADVPLRSWKAINALRPEIICHLLRNHEANNGLRWINTAAMSGVQPDHEVTVSMTLTLQTRMDHRVFPDEYRKALLHNADRVAMLAMKAMDDGDHNHPSMEFIDVVDYARQTALQNTKITASTWGRIVRHTRRWHQKQNIDEALARAEELRRKGYKAWHSLVEEFEHEGLQVVPLDDEIKLITEGVTMKHCVGQYANYTTSGCSRIFSIREQKIILATTEITRRGENDFKVSQTRAFNNNRPSEEAREAAEEVARRYSLAYQEPENQQAHQQKMRVEPAK